MNYQSSSEPLSQKQLYFSEEDRYGSKEQNKQDDTLRWSRKSDKEDDRSELDQVISRSQENSDLDSIVQQSSEQQSVSYERKAEDSREDDQANEYKQEEEEEEEEKDYCDIKKEPRDHYQYEEKIKPKRNQNITSIVDSQAFDRRLMQMAKLYHKNMVEQVLTQIKVKEEQAIKDEHQQPPFDSHLNQFPLNRFIQNEFGSLEKVVHQLEAEERHIERQLSALGHEIKVDFYQHYTKTIKKTDNKIFSIFSCKYHPKCQAIIKACEDKERCCVYLLRNKHCHNVVGEILEDEFPPEKSAYIDLDEDLHAMFGLHKGVITETRNKRYLDPKAKRQAQIDARVGNSESKPERGRSKAKGTSLRNITKRTAIKTTYKRDFPSLIHSPEDEFQDIIEELKTMKLRFEYDADYQKDKETQFSAYPKIIVMASKDMVDSFAQFGSITKLQLLKDVIKLKSHSWSLGIFSGSNSNIFPTVFGFCLVQSTEQMRVMYTEVLKSFFRMMDSEPTLIMTECSPEIIDAVEILKKENQYKGFHLLDQYQKLIKIKKEVRNIHNLPQFKLLLNSKSLSQTHRIWDQLLIKGQDKALSMLKGSEGFYIWSHIPEQLIGFSIDMSSSKKISSYLKIQFRHLPLKKTLKAYILKVLQAADYLFGEGNKSTHYETDVKVESIFNDKDLARVRKSVGSKVLNQVCKQYGQALELTFTTSDLGEHYFEDGHSISQEEKCTCRLFQYSGIPCKHLLKVLRSKKASYMTHIHPRWVIRNPEEQKGKQAERMRKKPRKYSLEEDSSSSRGL